MVCIRLDTLISIRNMLLDLIMNVLERELDVQQMRSIIKDKAMTAVALHKSDIEIDFENIEVKSERDLDSMREHVTISVPLMVKKDSVKLRLRCEFELDRLFKDLDECECYIEIYSENKS